jgi:hypothetical protein
MATHNKKGMIMSLKNIFIVLVVTLVLGGCAATPSYNINIFDQQFSEYVKSTPSIAVAKFDAFTPSSAIDAGALFGAIGLLVASAAISGDVEVFGINLQNETMKKLQEELSKVNVKYKFIDLMEGTNVEEVSKRFKSNRLWGFSSLKKDEIKAFFQKNPNVDFGVHITTSVSEPFSKLVVDTKWNIYGKNGSFVAKVNTKSVGDISKEKLSDKAYFDEVKKLQYKNIDEFIGLIDTGIKLKP